MNEQSIRAAIEARLASMAPPIATAWENVAFTPVPGTPYQRVNLMRAQPEDPEMSGTLRRHLGVVQITLFYPQGVGPGAAELRADAVAAHFPRKLAMSAGGVVVQIDGTAHVMAGFQDGDRWAVPVRVPYFANVSS